MDSIFPERVICSITVGICTHIYGHFFTSILAWTRWAILRRFIPICQSASQSTLPADRLAVFWAKPSQKTCSRSWTNASLLLTGICSTRPEYSSSEPALCPPEHRQFGSQVLGAHHFAPQIRSSWAARFARIDTATYHVPHDSTTKQTVTAASATNPHVCCTSV